MKIALREWLDNKKALIMMLSYLLVTLAISIINASVVMSVTKVIDDIPNFNNNIINVIICYAMLFVLSTASEFIFSSAFNGQFTYLEQKYADKILNADVEMFTSYSVAHVLNVGQVVWKITRLGKSMCFCIANLLIIIVQILSMYTIGGNIVIPVIGIYGIGAIFLKVLLDIYNKIDKEANKYARERDQIVENIINGFMEVRSFGMKGYHRNYLYDINHKTCDTYIRRKKVDCWSSGIVEVINALALITILIYTVSCINNETMTAASAMAIVMYMFKLMNPLYSLLNYVSEISDLISMNEEYDEIMNYRNRTDDNGTINLSSFEDNIEINNVSFAYKDSNDILSDISIKIKKGDKIGICGTSGGGKSTLFKLLNHFYNPDSGNITIDGIDIKDISENSFRKRVGSVHQENIIFPGSIEDNIGYGTLVYSHEELIDACKKANIYDFIMEQEQRFKTDVGPRGLKLSGGQKQRIALARLILKNPDIILLDEATSALDNESEYLIQDAIDKMGRDKTVISIAHRLSTIENCDKIYVIGKKGILEEGTHKQLMDKKGEYFRMYTKQFQKKRL